MLAAESASAVAEDFPRPVRTVLGRRARQRARLKLATQAFGARLRAPYVLRRFSDGRGRSHASAEALSAAASICFGGVGEPHGSYDGRAQSVLNGPELK